MAKRRKPIRVDTSALDLGEFAGGAADEQPAELSWRQDRSKSLSDWTIVVKPEAGGRDHTFHVHKAMIGAGARAAKYFHRCFDSSMAEAVNSTSTLTLLPSAVEAFALSASPPPSQTGRCSLSCVHAKTHGMALRVSMPPAALRFAGRLPRFLEASADDGEAVWKY